MDPQSALSYSSRALLLERLGRPDQALPDHDRALALEGSSTAYLKHRGLCYRTLGQYAAAIADFTRWVEGDAGEAVKRRLLVCKTAAFFGHPRPPPRPTGLNTPNKSSSLPPSPPL
jgi:tetratricopeptide (TPR) repeat protein